MDKDSIFIWIKWIIVLLLLLSLSVILYNNFTSNGSYETATLVETDNQDNIIIVGTTSNDNFPTKNSANRYQGSSDIYVIKLHSSGKVMWSILIGGDESDYPESLVIDQNNNIILSGTTQSYNFPTTENAFQTRLSDGRNLFITKISSSGDTLYSSYIGGEGYETDCFVTLDQNNSPVMIFRSTSSDILSAVDESLVESNTDFDIFLIKFTSSMQIDTAIRLTDSEKKDTVEGNTEISYYHDIHQVVSTSFGNIYMLIREHKSIFTTYPDGSGFGTTQPLDFMLVRLNSEFNMVWNSSIPAPTSYNDRSIEYIAIDNDNNLIVAYFEGKNITIAKHNPYFQEMWSVNVGGSDRDIVNSIAIASDNSIYFTGITSSYDLPVRQPFDATYNGTYQDEEDAYDAILGKVTSTGNLTHLTYFGGTLADMAKDITLVSDDSPVIVGYTASPDFKVYPSSALDDDFIQDGSQNFIIQFDHDPASLQWSTRFGGYDARILTNNDN